MDQSTLVYTTQHTKDTCNLTTPITNGSLTCTMGPPINSKNNLGTIMDIISNGSHATTPLTERKRFRFNIKYVGSAILNKNFTLPMLEWIARDIKRQTVRGGQSVNQRQFTIPARDIVFEIQRDQLMAISCKDGHRIFVHPMHCVSKYVQLQHDATCFSYLIRDTKDSPNFCHVFQAKSVNKVHEIFTAIRDATTRSQALAQPQTPSTALILSNSLDRSTKQQQQDDLILSKVQKSASSDATQFKSSSSNVDISMPADQFNSQKSPVQLSTTPPSNNTPSVAIKTQQPTLVSAPTTTSNSRTAQQQQSFSLGSGTQFENSYQFEVMFVKKVKLQCRRVPSSFVDDALETLKSFEVLKGGELKSSQIKSVGKRIINASVDERQEYDETCQSPPPPSGNINKHQLGGSGSSLNSHGRNETCSKELASKELVVKEERESRSCQQSPTKSVEIEQNSHVENRQLTIDSFNECSIGNGVQDSTTIKKHQSMDCLRSIDSTIRSAREGNAPSYANDFSPYNTITSNDLNERIAAIPVVSSSVSLDHETRQKLARQVRETIMATAATIKKDVYASGDKLDSSSSSKALDSLSCTVTSSIPGTDEDSSRSSPIFMDEFGHGQDDTCNNPAAYRSQYSMTNSGGSISSLAGDPSLTSNQRRSSAGLNYSNQSQTLTNNFDLFRRASARQVVKNRTMLLLICKDELCTISIDKHQMLFSKSFTSIVHCLQGNNNKDHFGIICRDSGKINPQTESYAGFIFKCQSDKVVREIMGALKQVIYNSHHNYHGYNSPYNPLNSVQTDQKYNQMATPNGSSPKLERNQKLQNSVDSSSLASRRGFINPIGIEEAAKYGLQNTRDTDTSQTSTSTKSASSCITSNSANQFTLSSSTTKSKDGSDQPKSQAAPQPKNLIKSMFCDNCPLYWFHRLCCDIESLPAEASKAIILRRIDSSLKEKEQDELYSRFSEFHIDSIDEHNEIFMSLLRNICEREQLKHNQTNGHISAIVKQVGPKNQSGSLIISSTPTSSIATLTRQLSLSQKQDHPSVSKNSLNPSNSSTASHQRSSSTSSLASVLFNQQANVANQASQSICDASSVAIDNLKKAKNSISCSIENILKRRASIKEEQLLQSDGNEQSKNNEMPNKQPIRYGSFKSSSRESRASEVQNASWNDPAKFTEGGSSLKRSQSTSDYSDTAANQPNQISMLSWRDSFTRTINDDSTNPLVGLFRRRSSTFGSKTAELDAEHGPQSIKDTTTRTSSGLLSRCDGSSVQASNPGVTTDSSSTRSMTSKTTEGGVSPSSMLSSVFWKKSIFDKIRQPQAILSQKTPQIKDSNLLINDDPKEQHSTLNGTPTTSTNVKVEQDKLTETITTHKRSSEELRNLWRKAIVEQITLIKMEKQNQSLLANNAEYNPQRIKLNYRDVIYGRDVLSAWGKLLKQDPTKKVDFHDVSRLVRLGVPKQRRGEIWMFLMNQYQLRHGNSFQPADSEFRGDANQNYRSLLSQLSVQQHEIFVDIGRTFPSHPYYSQYLGIGQLSLFNLLKAFSLLDQEVGYCQGLSFVAGVLLLHVDSEDEAFELMRHLLFNFGLRKQYLPSMNALHLQLYQITRLLRDYEYDLFNHFDQHDISPSLYAAPWFLTLFATQFSLGFVSRLLDLIFLMGIEAIFRVSLNLLTHHKASILNCNSLESTMQFMKNGLVNIDDKNLVRIFEKSMSFDLRNKLIEYEIEYTFYCAEDKARSTGRHGSVLKVTQPSQAIDKYVTVKQTTVEADGQKSLQNHDNNVESTSVVADATATVIIQHLLENNHLKSLRTNYTY